VYVREDADSELRSSELLRILQRQEQHETCHCNQPVWSAFLTFFKVLIWSRFPVFLLLSTYLGSSLDPYASISTNRSIYSIYFLSFLPSVSVLKHLLQHTSPDILTGKRMKTRCQRLPCDYAWASAPGVLIILLSFTYENAHFARGLFFFTRRLPALCATLLTRHCVSMLLVVIHSRKFLYQASFDELLQG
jgi:hypothetical protein